LGCGSCSTPLMVDMCPTAVPSVSGSQGVSAPSSAGTTTTSSIISAPPAATTYSNFHTVAVTQSSASDAFATTAPAVTTVVAGELTEVWTKTSIADLRTITDARTVATALATTGPNGHSSSTTMAVIVGLGGVWCDRHETRPVAAQTAGGCTWFFCRLGGGTDCFWPFCSQQTLPMSMGAAAKLLAPPDPRAPSLDARLQGQRLTAVSLVRQRPAVRHQPVELRATPPQQAVM
jgi:hypothetical protein